MNLPYPSREAPYRVEQLGDGSPWFVLVGPAGKIRRDASPHVLALAADRFNAGGAVSGQLSAVSQREVQEPTAKSQ